MRCVVKDDIQACPSAGHLCAGAQLKEVSLAFGNNVLVPYPVRANQALHPFDIG